MSSQELKQIEECYIDGGKYFSLLKSIWENPFATDQQTSPFTVTRTLTTNLSYLKYL